MKLAPRSSSCPGLGTQIKFAPRSNQRRQSPRAFGRIPRFILSQRASRLTLRTVREAAASAGVLPRWNTSGRCVCARQDNEPTQVTKGNSLMTGHQKTREEKKTSSPACESGSGSSAQTHFLFLRPEIRGKNQPSCQDLKLLDNRL